MVQEVIIEKSPRDKSRRHEAYFKCPKCGGTTFHIDAQSIANGGKPTAIECASCGWTGFA